MNDDAVGGYAVFPPVPGERQINMLAVVTQLDRIEASLSRTEGHQLAHTTALTQAVAQIATVTANTKWIVETVTGLMQVASTLPGVGGMMRKIGGQ